MERGKETIKVIGNDGKRKLQAELTRKPQAELPRMPAILPNGMASWIVPTGSIFVSTNTFKTKTNPKREPVGNQQSIVDEHNDLPGDRINKSNTRTHTQKTTAKKAILRDTKWILWMLESDSLAFFTWEFAVDFLSSTTKENSVWDWERKAETQRQSLKTNR